MAEIFYARRQFLQFLAASPLLLGLGACDRQSGLAPKAAVESLIASVSGSETPMRKYLDVFDFEREAELVLPPAHFGYLASGTDGDETLRANRIAFQKLYLRASRMVDTTNIDTSLQLLGQRLTSPIVLAPVGSQRAFHPEGELATARAARSRDHLQILSNLSTVSLEDVMAARGGPVWFQLYPTSNWSVTEQVVRRAERAGAPVLVLTVDANSGSKRTTMARYRRLDDRDCSACHQTSNPDAWLQRKPMYADTGVVDAEFKTPGMTWEIIERLRSITDMKIVIKGIVTREDATSAVLSGVDGVIVSNHGGRVDASGWGALDSLPEVVAAVDGSVPLMVDSGFRRGTDIFKALALGANAVCIGRPYIWGLAVGGQPGVERVLDILSAELNLVMGQMGAPTLADIGPGHVGMHTGAGYATDCVI